MKRLRFTPEHLDVGGDRIPVLVGRQHGDPRTVFMSYESFLEIAATLHTAVQTLKAVGVDPEELVSASSETNGRRADGDDGLAPVIYLRQTSASNSFGHAG